MCLRQRRCYIRNREQCSSKRRPAMTDSREKPSGERTALTMCRLVEGPTAAKALAANERNTKEGVMNAIQSESSATKRGIDGTQTTEGEDCGCRPKALRRSIYTVDDIKIAFGYHPYLFERQAFWRQSRARYEVFPKERANHSGRLSPD